MKASSVLGRLARDLRQKTPVAINLIAREGRVEDLVQCYAIYGSFRRFYSEPCWLVLQELWRTLVLSGRMQFFLVENRTNVPSSRIVSFRATIFATDEFCREAQSTLPPYLGMEVTGRYLARALPVLNLEQIGRNNALNGLNVIMCFGGCKHDGMSREQVLAVREKQAEAFQLAHSGYHMKEFLAETVGDEVMQWMLDSGAYLKRDYSRYFEDHGTPIPESGQRPWLVGLTKEEAFANPGSYLSNFFVYTPPRFHFNRSEQALLQHALTGETCKDLAASLFISLWTVKKRWQTIYQRVTDADRELLLPPIAGSLYASSRGAERRRRLLYYLRQHPEELRPFIHRA